MLKQVRIIRILISAVYLFIVRSRPRNPKLAPKHYVEDAEGLFIPHSAEEQEAIMKEYCRNYKTDSVVCYCHYCLEGLKTGGVDGMHWLFSTL